MIWKKWMINLKDKKICCCLMIQLVVSSIILFQRSQWLIEFDCSSILWLMKLLLCWFGYLIQDYEESFQFIPIKKNRKISFKSFNHQMNQFQSISLNWEWMRLLTQLFPFKSIWKNSSLQISLKFKYLLNWFNSSIEMIFNHLEILQSDFNVSFINWKEVWSFNSDYSFNRNCFLNVMEISHSSWIKSSIGFHQAFEWKIHLF